MKNQALEHLISLTETISETLGDRTHCVIPNDLREELTRAEEYIASLDREIAIANLKRYRDAPILPPLTEGSTLSSVKDTSRATKRPNAPPPSPSKRLKSEE